MQAAGLGWTLGTMLRVGTTLTLVKEDNVKYEVWLKPKK